MCDTSMMPLRVAMPKSVMKPTSEATERTPPVRKTPTTPPIRASGRFTMTSGLTTAERKTRRRMMTIATTTASPSNSSRRVADAALSNCPPYSIR